MKKNLKELLERLLKHDVDFVLAGGMACVVHGASVVTHDIDVCIAINESEVQKLREALKDVAPKHRMNPSYKPSFLEEPKSLKGVNNIYLETDLGILDILSELKPVGNFERVKSKSVTVSLFGYGLKLISLEDLIAIKEKMTRPKDKEAMLHLKEILRRQKR